MAHPYVIETFTPDEQLILLRYFTNVDRPVFAVRNFPEIAEIGGARAKDLYDRIFIEFGDDSVAQLGGAPLAVEQGSNILTKALEWGRLAGYLEQSTRYVPYDDKPGGR